MHKAKLFEMLQEEKGRLVGADKDKSKFEIINNIIQLKIKINKEKYINELYVDIKHLIDSNIETVEDERHCYDTIRFDIIEKYTNILSNKQKFSIARYMERRLKNNNFDDEVIKSIEIRKKTEIYHLIDEIKSYQNILKNILKVLLCATSYNLKSIIYTFLIILIIKFIIILPSPVEELSIFYVEYDVYSDLKILNVALNALASSLDISNNFTLTPKNAFSVILLVISKIFIFILFFNIIFKEIERRVFK